MSKRTSEAKVEAINQKEIKLDFEQDMIFPDEVWLKIITYLKTKDMFQNFGLVCKHFQNLTLDVSAIKYLELKTLPMEKKSLANLIEILSNAKFLREIKMILELPRHLYDRPIQNEIMNQVCLQALKSSNNLKSLCLAVTYPAQGFQVNPETMKSIETNGKEIEHLELSWIGMSSINMITSLAKLKSLKFYGIKSIDVVSLAKDCPKLDTIEFGNINARDKTSTLIAFDTFFQEKQLTLRKFCFKRVIVDSISTDEFLRNLNLCQNLEELQCRTTDLTQSSLDIIAQLPNLKRLTFINIWITSETMRNFLQKLNKNNLECLSISHCLGFDQNAFNDLLELTFPRLKSLQFSSETEIPGFKINSFVRKIFKSYPCIKTIEFYYLIDRKKIVYDKSRNSTTKELTFRKSSW